MVAGRGHRNIWDDIQDEGDDDNEEEELSVNDNPEFELATLSTLLDQINGWLDQLERKNADLQKQLIDLLRESKLTREELNREIRRRVPSKVHADQVIETIGNVFDKNPVGTDGQSERMDE